MQLDITLFNPITHQPLQTKRYRIKDSVKQVELGTVHTFSTTREPARTTWDMLWAAPEMVNDCARRRPRTNRQPNYVALYLIPNRLTLRI